MEKYDKRTTSTDKNDPTARLPLSNPAYVKDIYSVIDIILNNDNKVIKFEKFHGIENGADILEHLDYFSDTLGIEEDSVVDYEKDEHGDISAHGSDVISHIIVASRKRLANLKKAIQEKETRIYNKGIDNLLKKTKEVEWRCAGKKKNGLDCKRRLDGFNTAVDIAKELDKFTAGKYKACHNCREKNIFKITPEGKFIPLLIKK